MKTTQPQAKRKTGVYTSRTPRITETFGDEKGFKELLKNVRQQRRELTQLGKSNQTHVTTRQVAEIQDNIVANIRNFANTRNIPPEEVTKEITRLLTIK